MIEHTKAKTSPSSSRHSSRSPNREEGGTMSRSISKTPRTKPSSDYERTFPPFFLQSHTVICPQTRFLRDQAGLEYAQTKIDEGLAEANGGQDIQRFDFDLVRLLHIPLNKHLNHFKQYKSVKELVAEIRGTSRSPIDSTRIGAKSTKKCPDLLAAVPIKYLQFAEDVRPPYIGTFTKILKPKAYMSLCRNPFSRTLPGVNYDYDSEAEWEEPGEGEDLESEGEEEEEDDDADDIEEFLDDAEETGEPSSKHRLTTCGDLEPISTGLCWGDQGAHNQSNNGYKGGLDLKDFKIQTLSGAPIDHSKFKLTNVNREKINSKCPLILTRQHTGNLKRQESSRPFQAVVHYINLWNLPAICFISSFNQTTRINLLPLILPRWMDQTCPLPALQILEALSL